MTTLSRNISQIDSTSKSLSSEIETLRIEITNRNKELENAKIERSEREKFLKIVSFDEEKCSEKLQEELKNEQEIHKKYRFVKENMEKLLDLKEELRRKIGIAKELNEKMGKDVSGLIGEKEELEKKIDAVDGFLFKAPKVGKGRVQMSQAVEPMEDGCAICHGPLFGKVTRCATCSVQMHCHCANAGNYCESCLG